MGEELSRKGRRWRVEGGGWRGDLAVGGGVEGGREGVNEGGSGQNKGNH